MEPNPTLALGSIRRLSARLSLVSAILFAVGTLPSHAQSADQEAKLVASDGTVGDNFGHAVSISGDLAVVGSVSDDHGAGPNAGSAYVFRRIGAAWFEQVKLTASDASQEDQFGRSVAISGDTLLIGADREDQGAENAGAAYVFTHDGTQWTEQAKLIASDAAGWDEFGCSVALEGDTAVIGARRDDHAGSNSGSAYVFVRSGTTWTEQAKLTASDAAFWDQFGHAVAISGDTVLVGAWFSDQGPITEVGSAYVFVRDGSGWTEQAKLTAGDWAATDEFGGSVAISGDTALVGAKFKSLPGIFKAGSAYVFARSGDRWTEQAKLTASDAEVSDLFGSSVALFGNTAVVGAFLGGEPSVGSAYVFVRSGAAWYEQLKLLAGDAHPNDHFGLSVALSADTTVVGAPQNDHPNGPNSGSAYVFRVHVVDVSATGRVGVLALLLLMMGLGGYFVWRR